MFFLALRTSVATFRLIRERMRETTDPRHGGPAVWLADPTVTTALLDALWPYLEPVTALPRGGWTRDRVGRPRTDESRPVRAALTKAGIPARWPRRPRMLGATLRPTSLHDAVLMAVGLTPLR